MQLFYASHDGHTRRIAERLAARLAQRGVAAVPRDLAQGQPGDAELAGEPLLVVLAAIRYGHHLAPAVTLLNRVAGRADLPPLVMLSVNLTARKPGKDTAEGNAYLRKAIARHGLTPVLARAVAGFLDYPRYTWFDRTMIRFIMWMTGGPTDPAARVEFTDWAQVDAIADQIAALSARAPGKVSP